MYFNFKNTYFDEKDNPEHALSTNATRGGKNAGNMRGWGGNGRATDCQKAVLCKESVLDPTSQG